MVDYFASDVGVDTIFAGVVEDREVGEGGEGLRYGVREFDVRHGCEVHGPCSGDGRHVVASSSDCDPRASDFVNQSCEFSDG